MEFGIWNFRPPDGDLEFRIWDLSEIPNSNLGRGVRLRLSESLEEGLGIHRMGGLNRYGEPFFGVGSMVQSDFVPVK